MRIDDLSAPAMLTWQLTRDCNLACLHCCTDSAPGKGLPGELSQGEALGLAAQIIEAGVPYVMLCGGEPTIVPHFFAVAETLGRGGVQLKIETNGQTLTSSQAVRLARQPIRSVQISIDGATQAVYGKMRPGGSLEKALAACRAVTQAGLPLEITFAPARFNIFDAERVIALGVEMGAFRFNTGRLMPLGTAARLWDRLEPTEEQYDTFRALLERKERESSGKMELLFRPFSLEEAAAERGSQPPATLLVLPDGRVKPSAVAAEACADLKTQSLAQAWDAYREWWREAAVA